MISPATGAHITAEVYDCIEAAKAIGIERQSLLFLISNDILPKPILKEAGGDGTRLFSKGELLAIKKFLDRYAGPNSVVNMRAATHEIHQAIQAYRDIYMQ